MPRYPPERDLSLPDERLRRLSRQEDPQARSHQQGEAVAEAAQTGADTPGAGIAEEQATGAADVTGAVGPCRTLAPVTPAADKRDPAVASRCATGPDRLRNSLTRYRKRTWEERRSHLQPQGWAPASTQSCRDRGKQRQLPHGLSDSVQATNSPSQTASGQKKESGHETVTGSGTRVTASDHARPCDGQSNASAIVAAANCRSKRSSVPIGPGSSQKISTGIDETAHGQKGSVTRSHSESAFVHATANGPWSESMTPKTGHATTETESGHSDAPHENLDPSREIDGKSVSGSGPR